jgi:hypothetical protein
MVERAINGVCFQPPLERDGKGGYWFNIDESLRKAALTGSSLSLYTCTVVKDTLILGACAIYAGLPLTSSCFLFKQ